MASSFAELVCLSLWFLCSFRQSAGICEEKAWFGQDCVFACQCALWDKCDRERGYCTEKGCKEGFAGTACQYADVAYKQETEADFKVIGGQKYLANVVDGKHDTCFTEEGHRNLPLTVHIAGRAWAHAITLLLYDDFVASGKAASENDLEVTYYNDDNITEVLQPLLVQPHNTWVSYHLPQPAAVTKVQIRAVGNVSLALCGVSVLGGRNVAIKKAVKYREGTKEDDSGHEVTAGSDGVSSSPGEATDETADGSSSAAIVVDGDINSCFHSSDTAVGVKGNTQWTVSLGNNVNIWKVKVHSNQDGGAERPRFGASVTLTNGMEVEALRHDGTTDYVLPRPVPAAEVTVWNGNSEAGNRPELCEVEIFGDCVDGYYGWKCEQQCRCKDATEICDKIWGYCPQSKCQDGYKGDDCQKRCSPGTYGYLCAKNCSTSCSNHTCDHVTGICTNGCSPGWEGQRCEQASTAAGDEHLHGNDSDRNCTSGRCQTGCEEGMTGEQCQNKLPSTGNDAAGTLVDWTLLGCVMALMVF